MTDLMEALKASLSGKGPGQRGLAGRARAGRKAAGQAAGKAAGKAAHRPTRAAAGHHSTRSAARGKRQRPHAAQAHAHAHRRTPRGARQRNAAIRRGKAPSHGDHRRDAGRF